MFSFAFDNLSSKPANWKIIINGHEISCSKTNAELISKTISKNNKEQKADKTKDSYNITIQEFENPLICSDSDYDTFTDIFKAIPIQITSTNKDVLKIFATQFEIDELLLLLELYDKYYNLISSDKNLQTLKEITNKLINISEDDFEALLNDFQNIDNEILTKEFIYNLFLTTCLSRPTKIELLMSFLKKYEEATKGQQFQYFKGLITSELSENQSSKEIHFIDSYLNGEHYGYFIYKSNSSKELYNDDEIKEYKKTGYCPSKIYHVIKNDDIDSFIELVTSGGEMKFNEKVNLLCYERSSDILNATSYLDIAAFYGSEKIFNYILLNTESNQNFEMKLIVFALIGGNITIIHKCFENIEMNDQILLRSLLTTIKYCQSEIFEWLFENYDVKKFLVNSTFEKAMQSIHFGISNRWLLGINNENLSFNDLLIRDAIQYNNFDTLCYLLTNGFDHVSLFTLALVYNQFYLSELALKLPYDLNFKSKNIRSKHFYPLMYKYNKEHPLFISIFKNRLDFVKAILETNLVKPAISFENCGPLYFAVVQNNIEITKFFLADKAYSKKQVIKGISIFEYAVEQGFTEMSEFLINQPNVEKIGSHSFSLLNNVKEEIDEKNLSGFYRESNSEEAKKFVHFFLSKSKDKNVQKNKKEMITNNLSFFTCLAARYSDKKEFEKFLDSYKIDINLIDQKTIFFNFFF